MTVQFCKVGLRFIVLKMLNLGGQLHLGCGLFTTNTPLDPNDLGVDRPDPVNPGYHLALGLPVAWTITLTDDPSAIITMAGIAFHFNPSLISETIYGYKLVLTTIAPYVLYAEDFFPFPVTIPLAGGDITLDGVLTLNVCPP